MSENYGNCPRCRGRGFYLVKTGVRDPVFLREETAKESCNWCGGTGYDGSAEKYRDKVSNHGFNDKDFD